MLVFAAQNNNLTPEQSAAIVSGLLMVVLIAVLVGLAIHLVICALLYSCFSRIPPQHRAMEPAMVWLLLIPLFHLVWNFFVYQKLPDSYRSYFNSIGRSDLGDCGRGIGLAYAICGACTVIPCVNYAAAPAALVLLIIFLVKALSLKGQIGAMQQNWAPPAAP